MWLGGAQCCCAVEVEVWWLLASLCAVQVAQSCSCTAAAAAAVLPVGNVSLLAVARGDMCLCAKSSNVFMVEPSAVCGCQAVVRAGHVARPGQVGSSCCRGSRTMAAARTAAA